MVHVFTNNISRIIGVFPLAFVSALLIPSLAMADSESQPCTEAHLQIEHIHNTLQASKQRQQQLQKEVRTTYQQLFACKIGTPLSITQQHYCSQLEEKGPKQFQAMIEVTTLRHQNAQLLAHQAHHAQLTCPKIKDGKRQKITRLIPLQNISMNQ